VWPVKSSEPIQRKVTNYKLSSKSTIITPQDQLKAKLDKTKFTENATTVDSNIGLYTNISGSVPIANNVKATIKTSHGETHPDRSGTAQNHLGLIGKDEFFIRTGEGHAFEGGHVVPLSAWGANDTKVASANAYENIVPMSRTVNVGSWAVAEGEMKDGIKRDWEIGIHRQDYAVPYGAIAENFSLHLGSASDRERTINMDGITPSMISADPNDTTALPVVTGEPGTIAPPSAMITNGAQLKKFIQDKKGWQYLNDTMQTTVNGL
jgi:hypothetical protein